MKKSRVSQGLVVESAQKKVADSKARRGSGVENDDLRIGWRRDAEAQIVTSELGRRIRMHREALGMTLAAASDATKIPAASLSRIENNKMAPTFGVLMKLMTGLKISWPTLIGRTDSVELNQQVNIGHPSEYRTVSIAGYEYSLPLSGELTRIARPLILDVGARTLAQTGGLLGHQGVEFCYVLSGTLILHFAGLEAKELPIGGTALFNAELPHAYVAKGRSPAKVLNVVVNDPLIGAEDPLFSST